jgi:ribonuclease R
MKKKFSKNNSPRNQNKNHSSKRSFSAAEGGIEGIVKRNPDGFGFLIPDDREHPDVYIPRHSMTGIMTNDRVRARINRGGDRTRLSGEITEVVKHAASQVVGRYHPLSDKHGIIVDDEHIWGEDLRVRLRPGLAPKKGDLVVIEIKDYPGSDEGFSGVAKEVLGDALDPMTDTKRVIFQNQIPMEFSPETIAEAKKLPLEVPVDDLGARVDLRNLAFITIDGATAKDFDDAIYVESHPRGFKLWVAIADVSHYVKPGSPMDEDAYQRGNSTYFPHFVVPMLPEALSNELCSLKPRVPRYSMVAEMVIDRNGSVIEKKFYEAVIKSRHRVTYGQAQEVIEGQDPGVLSDVKPMILLATDLAKILMKKRFEEGSLDLEIPETQILIDDAGIPTDIIRTERLFAHRLIEELMLIANVSVAKLFHEKGAWGIYRVHDQPAAEALGLLENFIRAFGGSTKDLAGGKLQKKITAALKSSEGKPESQILHILTLRSMKQAEYKHENIGHFGLGFEHYTHFTSPIRRYSDLIVHRILKSIVVRGPYKRIPEDELARAGTQLSACEQRSVKAERQFQSIKKARFMIKHVGKEFDGMISSVTRFGAFVLLRDFDVDGLVKLDQLGNDKWEFDEENLQLVGKRTGKHYKIGDPLRIQVASANPDSGQLDFILATSEKAAVISQDDIKRDRYGEVVSIRKFDPSRFDAGQTDRPKFGSRSGRKERSERQSDRRDGKDRRKDESRPDKRSRGGKPGGPKKKSRR